MNSINNAESAKNIGYNNTGSGLAATDVQGAVDELAEEKAGKSDIAPEFNITTAYAKGDLCYHEGTLYEFNQAHAAGVWNSAHADATNLDEIVNKRVSVVNNGNETLASMLNRLFAATDLSKVTHRSKLIISTSLILNVYFKTSTTLRYTNSSISNSNNSFNILEATLTASDSKAVQSKTAESGSTSFNVFSSRTSDTNLILYY